MISKQPTEVVNAPEGVEVHASGVETVGVDEAIHIMQAALTIGVVHSAADRINSALGGNEE